MMERLLYRGLRVGWRVVRRVPGVSNVALRMLHGTGLGARVASVISPAPPARFVEHEVDPIDYNSSTYGTLRPYPRLELPHFQALEEAVSQGASKGRACGHRVRFGRNRQL